MFAILTRLHPNPKCDPITKLRLYSGEKVVEKGKLGRVDARELRDDTRDEEMDDISTRFIMKALDNALSDDIGARCLTPINVRRALIKMAEKADLPPEVIAYRWSSNRRGETLFYRSYEPPKEAIEKRLVTSVREVSRGRDQDVQPKALEARQGNPGQKCRSRLAPRHQSGEFKSRRQLDTSAETLP